MSEQSKKFDLRQTLVEFLSEDVGTGDITSNSIIPPDKVSRAVITCRLRNKERAILSGIDEARTIFEICGCECKSQFREASPLHNKDRVLEIAGYSRSILKAERTALNLIMRMSGIATQTQKFVAKVGHRHKVKILATRKTAPGLRYFDKKAVVAGGGATHRMRLDDMVLIKDNHLDLVGSAAECIRNARGQVGKSMGIECEVRDEAEAILAIKSGADIVMLDNFTPAACRKTVRQLERMGLRSKSKIEVSGGINLRNIKQYAESGPDFISVGRITHSANAVDFSLEMI